MAIATNSAITKRGSRHEVVWAHDPCVQDAPGAGWVRADSCTVGRGADIVVVQGLDPDEQSQLRDLHRAARPSAATLAACRMAILEVNGSRKRRDVEDWIKVVWAHKGKSGTRIGPVILDALALYVGAISNGEDPLETVSPMVSVIEDSDEAEIKEDAGDDAGTKSE